METVIVVLCVVCYVVGGFVTSALLERFYDLNDGILIFLSYILWPIASLITGVVLGIMGSYNMWKRLAGWK
jgi:hypothetical protein